ncbi:KRR1 small subunit processome component [Diplonema papillatum]|nr:KRR1 small subunit processome component [Diplonema papillatum]
MADTDKEADQASKYEMPEWTKDSAAPCLMEKSKFATLFPKYLENYLQTVWKDVLAVLKHQELDGKLDLIQGSMTVLTTKKTWDPYSIIKARDFIKLLSRSVPLHQAQKIFQDDITYDIIKISSMVRNKERFVKRRQRIIGPNAQTLKALELLTETYLLVQGNTVAVMGTWKGCKAVRKVVTDCMRNVHPIYGIKQLLIKRELGKDPEMKNEDWSKYVPQFRKTHQKKRKLGGDNEEGAPKKKAKKEKKPYTAFPPEQQPRKEDLLMASGEFWRLEQEKEKQKEKKKKQETKLDEPALTSGFDDTPKPKQKKEKAKKKA